MSKQFMAGDMVLVVGNICRVRTCIGLFGFVDKVFEKEQQVTVQLLAHPTLDEESDRRAEARKDFHTTFAVAKHDDLRALEDPECRKRVAALIEKMTSERDQKPDPIIERILADERDPAHRAREAKRNKAIARRSEELGDVYPLPGRIKRYNKSNFPAFSDPRAKRVSQDVQRFAAKGPKKCTVTEHAKWRQGLAASDACSFWSPRPEARAAVREFDLDPMADEFNDALYRSGGSVYAPNGTLRNEIIKLWNQGAVIVDIGDMEDEDTCWCDWNKGEPAGFSIKYNFRRTLPTP